MGDFRIFLVMDVTKQICILDIRKEVLTFKTKHVTILEAVNSLYNRIFFSNFCKVKIIWFSYNRLE